MHIPRTMIRIVAMIAALAAAPALAQDAVARLTLCQTCHGPDGNSRNPQYPVIAGQPMIYMFLRLKQLQQQIENPEMTPIARSLSDKDVEWLATYFSGKKNEPGLAGFDATRAERGKQLAARLGCAQCHQANYAGANQMPRLAGQHAPYLVAQMQLILANRRSDDNGNMVDMLRRIQPQDIEDLSHYFASLP